MRPSLVRALLSFSDARQTKEKLNSLEPTLTLDHLLCKGLGQCSLQTCAVVFLYEVDVYTGMYGMGMGVKEFLCLE